MTTVGAVAALVVATKSVTSAEAVVLENSTEVLPVTWPAVKPVKEPAHSPLGVTVKELPDAFNGTYVPEGELVKLTLGSSLATGAT